MGRPKGSFKQPSYRHHKGSGQAITELEGRTYYLGKFESKESRERYDQLVGEWYLRGRLGPSAADPDSATINQLLAGWFERLKTESVAKSKKTHYTTAAKWLKQMYGSTKIADFGTLQLKALREKMILAKVFHHGRECDRTLSRGYVNDLVKKMISIFRWGAEVEIVPFSIYNQLSLVRPLKRGQTAAREGKTIKPVEQKDIDAVLRLVNPTFSAMIRLQLLTGMRSGELCQMRTCDIDTSHKDSDGKPLWRYRPLSHKTERYGKERIIFLGVQCQEILLPFLKRDINAFIFSPRDRTTTFRFNRNKVHPNDTAEYLASGKHSAQACPTRWRDFYEPTVYAYSIKKHCDVADRIAHRLNPKVPATTRIVNRWHPHQLRHNAATYIRREFGLEAASVVLGHSSLGVTEIYAERDFAKAAEIMSKVG